MAQQWTWLSVELHWVALVSLAAETLLASFAEADAGAAAGTGAAAAAAAAEAQTGAAVAGAQTAEVPLAQWSGRLGSAD